MARGLNSIINRLSSAQAVGSSSCSFGDAAPIHPHTVPMKLSNASQPTLAACNATPAMAVASSFGARGAPPGLSIG
jgi:hypothetical protein